MLSANLGNRASAREPNGVTDARESIRTRDFGPRFSRPLPIFASWRLQVDGYLIAIMSALLLVLFYSSGVWLIDSAGLPTLNDFTDFWIVGTQALRGEMASVYGPAGFAEIQAAVVGPVHGPFYPNWPYPPIFLLIIAPFATLPYVTAFLSWEAVTLIGFIAVVFLIVPRASSIALVLASPFTIFNFLQGQSGFLAASLFGAALLALERRPVLAGIAIGCLTFKPHLGVLFPVALVAGGQWRSFTSAVVTLAVLVGVSIAAFGIGPWEAFPREVLEQGNDYLRGENPWATAWTYFQTVYGLVRAFYGNAALAWLAQGCAAATAGIIVWLVWHSQVRYPLKAAMLPAAALIATPYAQASDMAPIAISVAFLARDQIRCGLLRGEQTILIALFVAGFWILVRGGYSPVGPVIMIMLVGVILRRAFWSLWTPLLLHRSLSA